MGADIQIALAFHGENAGQVFKIPQHRRRLDIGQADGHVLPLGCNEIDIDHAVDGIDPLQCNDQNGDGHADTDYG